MSRVEENWANHSLFEQDARTSLENIYSRETRDTTAPSKTIQLIVKRLIDVAVSASALFVLLPVLILIAVIIRCESRGSPLFRQQRWGKDQSRIEIFKFRSMRKEYCDPTGVAQTVANDRRITYVGAILRKTNLDELPQLWNVLRGDMSLVGPRCHAIGMQAGGMLYEELVPQYHQRHVMKPGLTGLAQMRGLRGPTDRPARARARIAADLHYVGNFSVMFDIRIMFGTIASELTQGKGF